MRFSRTILPIALTFLSLSLVACARRAAPSATVHPETQSGPESQEKDRQAILAMAGRYRVTFHFEEILALHQGYKTKPVKDTGAQEWVLVVASRPDFVSLQHILVMGEGESQFVLKHWRQDWAYEPDKVLQFAGGNTWTMKAVTPAQRRGVWSQTVYQVDDSPRYGGLGRWQHDHGLSQWTAQASWRPLPRRDMTTRSDYHTIDAVQRHVLTPFGWAHEQDNTKIVLRGQSHALVREIGLNAYRKDDTLDISKAKAQWDATKDYWNAIRAFWNKVEQTQQVFGLTLKGETAPLYTALLGLAERIVKGEITQAQAAKEGIAEIKKHLTFNPAPLQQRLRS